MMIRVFWLIRVTAFVVIGILALVSPPYSAVRQATRIACFSAVGPAVALVTMAVAGGVAGVTDGSGQTLVACACIAAFWAGGETDLWTTIGVAVAGIVSIWVAGAGADSNFGTMAGAPQLIAVCAIFGLQRRSYRVQAEQSAALLTQHERLRAEQRRADALDERARIAREIHDVLAHSPGALGIQIPGHTGGYGLTGMRERLRLLNGTLRAGPKENERAVTAELPLAAAQDGIAR